MHKLLSMTSQNQQGKDLHNIVEFVLLILKFIVVPSKKKITKYGVS